jgi:rhomboid protease GluP
MKHINVNFFTWLKINFKVTFLILGFNILMYLITAFLTYVFFGGNDTLPLIMLGAHVLPGTEQPFSVLIPEFWRFLTAAFLHDGILHLAMNMFAFYSLGLFVEEYFGGRKLFLTFIFTAITGSLLSFIMALLSLWQNQGVPNGLSVSVGASGAIFGLVGLVLGNRFFRKNTYAPEINIDTNGLWVFVIINLVIGFGVNLLGTGVYINNWAHLGGLLGGLILGAFLNIKRTFDVPKWRKIFEQVLFILSVLIFVVFWVLNIISILANYRQYL